MARVRMPATICGVIQGRTAAGWAALGAVLLIWGVWYDIPKSVWTYMAVSGTIYLSGAGVVLLGGIYWKRASTVGAECSPAEKKPTGQQCSRLSSRFHAADRDSAHGWRSHRSGWLLSHPRRAARAALGQPTAEARRWADSRPLDRAVHPHGLVL